MTPTELVRLAKTAMQRAYVPYSALNSAVLRGFTVSGKRTPCRRSASSVRPVIFSSSQRSARKRRPLPWSGIFRLAMRDAPFVQTYFSHRKQNALSCSPWNSQRPSCTIGSSCYRYSASLPKNSHFSVKTASILTCDLEMLHFRVRGLPSHGLPQWRPFGQTASLFLAAASRAQLRANGLKTFVLSSPAQYRISVRGRELHVFRCV